ncbi:MAG: hypothetical protein M3Y33_15870 [Actinomycetota bacterium]|nr:hypothetical protein [Actinomycetota bacterium]
MTAAFSWLTPVFFDELDLNRALHNSRFAVHVERASRHCSSASGKAGHGWLNVIRISGTWSGNCIWSSWHRSNRRAPCASS